MNRLLTLIIYISLTICVAARTGDGDSLRITGPADSAHLIQPVHVTPQMPGRVKASPAAAPFLTGISRSTNLPVFRPQPIIPGSIARWKSGGLSGIVSSESKPGLMGIESGQLIFHQEVGNFSFVAYGEALKYGFYRGLSKSVGFGGSLTYRASDRLSLTVFGSYYTSPGAMSPAMAGYAAIPSFGGYLDYSFNDRWGVRVGAHSYRSMPNGRWQAQPIVMPYFRLNKKDVIGIDVGGILYQLFYWNRNNGIGRRGNPTIPPPVMKMSDMY